MPLYRLLSNVALGEQIVPAESFHQLRQCSPAAIAALLKKGAIVPATSPPLAVLPGWQTRAARLAALGIEYAVQFIDADVDELARALRRKPAQIEAWQAEVLELLTTARGTRRRG